MLHRILPFFLLLLLVGCESFPVLEPVRKSITPATQPKEEAQIVFIRSSLLASAIKASLYEVTDGEIKFIGLLENETQITYTTKPGKHVFMLAAEGADFMEADLSAGRDYFSIVAPRMGAWKAKFSLWPVKRDANSNYHTGMPELTSWIKNTSQSSNTEESYTWYEQNKESVGEKYQKHWPAWQAQSTEALAQKTLNQEDGLE